MTDLVFVNATVLDVTAGTLVPDSIVAVENGRIVEVGKAARAPKAKRTIDCKGRVVMPGLCDAHVHVNAVTPNLQELETWPESYLAARAGELGRAMLLRGFTTIRDAGGADFGLARAFAENLMQGPRLLFSGKALSQTGGHGDMRQPGDNSPPTCPCCGGLTRICDGVAEVRRACRDEIRKGATQIKLMLGGGVASPTDRIDSTQFSEEEIAAAVEEASAANIYCLGHAYTARSIIRAVKLGVRSIEHGNLLDAEAADTIKAHGAFLVPTLVTYNALAEEGVAAGLPAAMIDKLGDILARGLSALELALSRGVTTVFGTDLLGTMQRHQLREFSLRAQVQKPIDVIRAATLNAAELFQMPGQIGVVAPGAYADLLVIDGDPLTDIGVLEAPERNMRMIVKGGAVVAENGL